MAAAARVTALLDAAQLVEAAADRDWIAAALYRTCLLLLPDAEDTAYLQVLARYSYARFLFHKGE